MAVSFNGVILCDNSSDDFDGHQGLRISAQERIQIEDVIRSQNPFGAGRGNSVYTVSFSSTRRHASTSAAASFCGTHSVATRGTAGFSGFGLTLDNAVCNAETEHLAGVTTRTQYSITGTKTPEDIV